MSHSEEMQALAAGLGRIPSGLFVLTFRHGSSETGMLASWVQQCAFDPPHISFSLNLQRPVLAWLTTDAPVTVNILAEGQKQFLSHFGKGFDLGQPAFEGISLRRLEAGAPVLVDAHAFLECRVAEQIKVADHLLVVARVIAGGLLSHERPGVHVRRSGMHY